VQKNYIDDRGGIMIDVIGYQDKVYKGQCLDCGLDIYAQKFNTVNEQCESCKE